jgi:hypothetical protein
MPDLIRHPAVLLNPNNSLERNFPVGAALAAIIFLYNMYFAAKAAPTKAAPHFDFSTSSNESFG